MRHLRFVSMLLAGVAGVCAVSPAAAHGQVSTSAVLLTSTAQSQTAPNRAVTLVARGQSLREALDEIGRQAGMRVMYGEDVLRSTARVTIQLRNAAVATAVDRTLRGTGLVARFLPGAIMITRAPVEAPRPEIQQGGVSGRVTNGTTGEPMAGAQVLVVGTTRGAVTAADGRFTLTGVPAGSHRLRVTMIGYAVVEQAVVVAAGQAATVNVTLRAQAVALEGVVAVGYGTQRRRDVTGAVGSANLKGIEEAPTATIEQAIAGRVAGVQVVQASNAPGGGISMRIRGTSSIHGSLEPLYVVDGLPIEADVETTINAAGAQQSLLGGGGRSATNTVAPSPLSALNPSDIESVEILKDASATAIYGARGANGVVLITTKRGRTVAPRISLNFYTGTQSVTKKVEVLNAREFAQFTNMYSERNGFPLVYPDLDNLPADTDWQDEVFRSAPMQNYQVTVSGATTGENRTRYALSGGYFTQDGVVIGSGFERYSARVNVDQQVGSRVNVGMNLSANRAVSDNAATDGVDHNRTAGVVSGALQYQPTMPVQKANGTYTTLFADAPAIPLLYPTGNEVPNPVAMAVDLTDDIGHMQLLGNIFADYELLDGLTARVALGGNGANRYRRTFYPSDLYYQGVASGGQASRASTESLSWSWENTLTFDRKFGDIHALNLLGGYTREATEISNESMSNSQFVTDITEYWDIGAGNATRPGVGSGYRRRAMQSVLARANYNLLDRYLFTLTGRYDGSSRFGAGNKWGFFPSGAIAWRVSSEPFMERVPAVSDLKLRASYGVSGNTAINPYQSVTLLDTRSYSFNNSLVTGYMPGNVGNPELHWESTAQLDLGVDLELFDGRANVVADWYDKRTDDLLGLRTLPVETGFNNVWQNFGTIQNRGIELTLGGDVLAGDGNETPSWNTSFNVSRNRNKVLDLGGLDEVRGIEMNSTFGVAASVTRVGFPIGFFTGYRTNGIFRDSADAASYPARLASEVRNTPGELRFVDMTGDGIVDNQDLTMIGSPQPDFTLGWQNTMGFKGLELTTSLQGVFGNDVINMNLLRLDRGDIRFNILKRRFYDSWSPQNPDARYPNLFDDIGRVGGDLTDISVEDGSFLRLRSATLSYDVPTQKVRLGGLSRARVYVTGANLLTWSDYSGYNPDVSSYGVGAMNSGVDIGAYPLYRSVTIGIDVTN